MAVSVRTWAKNKNSVSVDYGPLTFSLKIGEKWSQVRRPPTANWPEFELLPTTPWNYGLVLDAKNPAGSFELVRSRARWPAQPFTPETAPLALKAKARKIPGWTLDEQRPVERLAAQSGEVRRAGGDGDADSDGGRAAADFGLPHDRRRARRPRLAAGEGQIRQTRLAQKWSDSSGGSYAAPPLFDREFLFVRANTTAPTPAPMGLHHGDTEPTEVR